MEHTPSRISWMSIKLEKLHPQILSVNLEVVLLQCGGNYENLQNPQKVDKNLGLKFKIEKGEKK